MSLISPLEDDFESFLDRSRLFEKGRVFDAVGLPPGSAPRERRLIGHESYSEMTRGVGRGTIFNHRDPLHSAEEQRSITSHIYSNRRQLNK